MRGWHFFFAMAALSVAAFGQNREPGVVRGMVELDTAIEHRPFAQIDSEVVILPVFSGEELLSTALDSADTGLKDAVRAAVEQGSLSGKLYESVAIFAPAGLATSRLVLLGAGGERELDAERIRRMAGAAVRNLRDDRIRSVAFHLRGPIPVAEAAGAVVEGALLGLFDAGIHKTGQKSPGLKRFLIAGISPADRSAAEGAIQKAKAMAEATNLVRSITVEPANSMTPEALAAQAREIARVGGLEVEVFDEKQIEEMGMGGVIAVGKGSANPPRFIVLRYEPARPSDVTLALVGKGVCFDSGGISLKAGEGMYRMKGDMAGGASVLGVMKIVSRLEPRIRVLGIIPAVENMPGPTAQKPGDVFVGYSGKTVEVLSTDAEGRLILSDGISYAVTQGATHLVDIATLTGTVRRALGDRHVGAFASDDSFYEMLVLASEATGESFWRLPIDEEYAQGIKKSLVADLNETGGVAGASVGAKFIQQFTEGKPWIHLDIAGTSWPTDPVPYRGAGPTGVSVRTLAELAMRMGEDGSPSGSR